MANFKPITPNMVHYPARDKMHCGHPLGDLKWSRDKGEVTCPGCISYINIKARKEKRRKEMRK